MITKKFELKIISKELTLFSHKTNLQFIYVSNIKIETVDSYLNRNGQIVQYASKVKRKNRTNQKYLYSFQKNN